MRIALPFALAAMLVSVPALASDRQVPQSTLAAVGLSDLEVISDTRGDEVRGMMYPGVRSFGVSMVSGLIIDPVTNSFIFGSDANTSSSSSLGGIAASQQSSAVTLNLVIEANGGYPGFYGTLVGGSGGSAFAK